MALTMSADLSMTITAAVRAPISCRGQPSKSSARCGLMGPAGTIRHRWNRRGSRRADCSSRRARHRRVCRSIRGAECPWPLRHCTAARHGRKCNRAFVPVFVGAADAGEPGAPRRMMSGTARWSRHCSPWRAAVEAQSRGTAVEPRLAPSLPFEAFEQPAVSSPQI